MQTVVCAFIFPMINEPKEAIFFHIVSLNFWPKLPQCDPIVNLIP